MGGSGIVGLKSRLLAFGALTLAACSDDLPPCGAIDIATSEQTRSQTTDSPTVMAISDGVGNLIVLRECSGAEACAAELIQQVIPIGKVPEQILLTGSGRWLTYVDSGGLQRVDLHAENPSPSGFVLEAPFARAELVGSLRGGDWILVRTWASNDSAAAPPTHASDLVAQYVGDDESFPFASEARGIVIDDGDFRVAAVGHRNIVVREALADGHEEISLVRIAPSFRQDEHGSSQIGETLTLARGSAFQRVIITSGASPDQLGDQDAFPGLPNDQLVIATSGTGDDARTLVYDIRDLSLVANFEGAVVTSLLPLHDVPGLSAVAPDRSHLAYVTQRGALALRNLESQTSCELRSDTGQHVMAGFASDGTLYFQSREDDLVDDPEPRVHEFDRVYAYDLWERAHTLLSEFEYRRPLRAVPEFHQDMPWAVVAADGPYATIPGVGIQSIGVDSASFLSRGDDTLWVLGADAKGAAEEFGQTEYELSLSRIRLAESNGSHSLATDAPSVVAPGEMVDAAFRMTYLDSDRICVSVAQASHAPPWATQCSDETPEQQTKYLSDTLPQSEQQD